MRFNSRRNSVIAPSVTSVRKSPPAVHGPAYFRAMMLLYTLFAKFVPIISIWEMKAGDHQPSEADAERVHAVAEGRLEETHA